MIVGKLLHIISAMLVAILATSCQPHDPFCFHHPHNLVIVEYDWSEAPDAIGIGGTRALFYRSDDGSYVMTADFSGMKGGEIYLREGEYDVISYNSDTEKLFWRGSESITSLETYTRNASLTEELPGFNYEKIPGLVLTPDRIWSAQKMNVKVNRNDTTVITLMPRKVTYEVIWEVTGIKGANRVNACAVSISNVGGSLYLKNERTDNNESLMSGIGKRITKNRTGEVDEIGGFSGKFESFGCTFSDDCKHTFTIYCWAKGGNIKSSYDVTDQFHIVKEDRKIYIKIDADFSIPTGGGDDSESGFIPDVSDWGVVNQDIYI